MIGLFMVGICDGRKVILKNKVIEKRIIKIVNERVNCWCWCLENGWR